MAFFIGLAAGVFGGLAGLGGGAVMIPLMVGLLKVGQHKAHGTSMLALVFTGILGAAIYGLGQAVDVAAAFLLAIPAIVTARMGARYCHVLPEWKLKRAFGAFLMAVSVLMVLKAILPHPAVPFTGLGKGIILILTGLTTGFMAGLMGIGGGALMIISMVLIVGYDQHTAQGTALLAIIPAGIMGAFTHWRLGNMEVRLLKGLIPGILIGTSAGSSLALLIPDVALRVFFVAVLIWIGMHYLRIPRSEEVCLPEE